VSSFDEVLDGEWPLGFSEEDRIRFTELVLQSFASRHITVAGLVPDLVLPGGGLLNLRNLAASCDGLRHDVWATEIDHFIGAIAAQPNHAELSPELARASLRLRLLVDSGEWEHLVSRPSMPGLALALFVRRPHMGQSITSEMLDAWGISNDEAFDLAERNTWQYERGELMNYEDVSVFEGESLFTSTSVLRINEWFDVGQFGAVVAVPTRHVVLAKRLDQETMGLLGSFSGLAQELMDQGAGPTASLLWYIEPATFGRFGDGAELVSADIIESPGLEPRLEISVGPKLGDALERLGRSQLG
jgi:hypothetical protein